MSRSLSTFNEWPFTYLTWLRLRVLAVYEAKAKIGHVELISGLTSRRLPANRTPFDRPVARVIEGLRLAGLPSG